MTILITSILIISLLFIATERQTNINKAAVAVFACTLGWVLYICFGSDFVESRHLYDYTAFLNGIKPNPEAVKLYIAKNVFLPYVGRAAEIVLLIFSNCLQVDFQGLKTGHLRAKVIIFPQLAKFF